MNLLLDTHVLLWWLGGVEIAQPAGEAIADPHRVVFISAASIWEISIKRAAGKLRTSADIAGAALESGFEPLPVTFTHADAAGRLPLHHLDPFDRMLIAQGQIEGLTVVTRDEVFARYDGSVMSA
ncbi:MAG: type II toxin-antitoxin system VapC family toxin [Acidimicrobiia bacterium]